MLGHAAIHCLAKDHGEELEAGFNIVPIMDMHIPPQNHEKDVWIEPR